MTILMGLLATLFAIVGGVIAISQPDTLSFDDYLDRMGELALAVAALGFGRSVRKGLAHHGEAANAPDAAVPVQASRSLNDRPLMTITLGIIVLIAAVVGGVVTIADPATLDFGSYLDKMNEFAFAVGAQGAGRALRKGLEQHPNGGGGGMADFEALPDHPASPVDLGPAVPEVGITAYQGEEDLSFVDPADEAALDEDLGSDEEPGGAPEESYARPRVGTVEDAEVESGVLDAQLPSDEEEAAAPPPLPDEDALDEPDDPTVRMPSQDEPPDPGTQESYR
jgi:hypothetical protein